MSRSEVTLDIGSANRVVLTEIAGDVLVEGWDQEQVSVDADEEALTQIEMMDDEVHVSAQGDCRVRFPSNLDLRIGPLRGDLRVSATSGMTEIATVAGDLSLRDVGPVHAQSVAGDFSARAIDGDLEVQSIAADAAVRRVAGALTLSQVGADLFLSDVGGNVAATAGADAKLFIAPRLEGTYKVTAGSDINCVLPDDANVDVVLISGSGTVQIALPDIEIEESGGRHQGRVGDGGAMLELTAGADIALTATELGEEGVFAGDFSCGFGSGFEAWADDFAGHMQAHAEMVTEHVGERLRHVASAMPDVLVAAGLPDKDAQRIAMRVEVAGQRAVDRAAKHADRAARKAERCASHAARRAERRGAGHGPAHGRHRGHGRRGKGESAASAGVSAEERLSILRMVEEGKLSVDDAERLLRALEEGQQ